MPRPARSPEDWRSRTPQPHCDGPADPLPRRCRPRANTHDARILRAARFGRDDISEATSIARQASAIRNTPGIWSAEQVAGWRNDHSRPSTPPAGECSCSSGTWAVYPIPAIWMARCRSRPAPSRQGPCQPARPRRCLVTPRALETREIAGHRRSLSPGRSRTPGGRLRRRRNPRRQWLSARPIPPGQHQHRTTITAARSRTAPGSCSKWPMP